jgi:putative transposase
MRKSRFTDEQIVAMLRKADRSCVAEVAERHKVSERTICGWRKPFNGLERRDIKRLKALETENAKLRGFWPNAILKLIRCESSTEKNG